MYYTPKNLLIDLLQAQKQADKYNEILGNPPFSIRIPNAQVLERCECGCGDVVTLQNGERHCSDTLRKFEMQNGRPYGVR